MGGTTDTGTERVGQATRGVDHRQQVQTEEDRQLIGRTTDTRRRVRRAGQTWGGPQTEEGRQLVGMTTDTRRRVRRAGNYRRVNRAGNSLGGQKSEEGRQLMEGTTDTGTK